MDVEGHEVAILRGAEDLLDATDSLACNIEFHAPLYDEADREYLIDLFERLPPREVLCVATQRPTETTHSWPGIREFTERSWSPQVVFRWI